MKKPFILFLVLVALAAFAYYYSASKDREVAGVHGGAKMRELLLPDLSASVNDVRKIRFRDQNKTLELAVKDGEWRVEERGDYPASFEKIHRVLMSLMEMKISGKEVIHKNSLAAVKLVAPADGTAEQTGLEVDLINAAGGNVASFIIGGGVESSGGASNDNFMGGPSEQRFIRVLKDDTHGKDEYTAWEVSESLYDIQSDPKQAPKAEDWIDKAFVDVKKPETVAITHPKAADSWTAGRVDENSEFKLLGAKPEEELDTAKASGLSSVLSMASFTDVVPKDKVTPDMLKDASKATIKTFEGFTYEVAFAPKKAKSASDSEAYYFTVKVSANFPKARKADPKEKAEDKKKKDDQFAADTKQLDDKLTKEKAFEGWVYEVSSSTVSILTKKKSEVLREKPAAKPAAASKPATPPLLGPVHTTVTTPPVTVTPAPAHAPTPPAAATKPAPAPTPTPAPAHPPTPPAAPSTPPAAASTTPSPAPSAAPTTPPPTAAKPTPAQPKPDAPKPPDGKS